MNRYRSIIGYINYIAFLVLLCAMPYAFQFIRFFGLVWAVSWLLELRFLNKEFIQITKSRMFVAVGFGIWVLWNVISIFWADNKTMAWDTIQRDIYLLIIPIIMIFGVNEYYDWKQCVKVLVIGCIISIGVYLFTNYWLLNLEYVHNKHVATRVNIDWLHLEDFTMNMKHRLHYTSLMCLAILGISTLFVQRQTNFKQTILYCFAIVALLLGIYWTSSRAAILNIGFIATITALWIWTRKAIRSIGQKVVMVIAVALILVIGIVCFYKFYPRNANISISYINNLPDGVTPPCEPRLAIWNSALEAPQDYSLYGLGIGNSYDYMQSKYIAHGWEAYYTYHYSTHSQLLATWIELGFAAMVLWLLFWLTMPFVFHGKQRYWLACISAVCLTNMATDLFLGSVEGIVFTLVAFVLFDVFSRPFPSVVRPKP